ncbi:MAG TPA: rhomboid family intramembrane serine protease [Xanthomonadaceae bacterium]|nr:rhomboid family intramembrane serine protease [Xanthomonadaceae bacterium]
MFVKVETRARNDFPWALLLLVLVSVLLFVLLAMAAPEQRQAHVERWGAVPETLFGKVGDLGDVWHEVRGLTLFSALFVHADWLHLLGNLLFLILFGVAAERALGPARFLLLFLAGGALSMLAAALIVDSPGHVIIGSSGAVSAILGAYVTLFPRARLGLVVPLGLYLEFVRVPAALLIGFWALLQVLFSYVGPSFGAVAWSAHLAGFVIGVLFALASRPAVFRRLRG